MDIPVKPTVLIADDSRIVRATLIKRIEGMFDFREALDGEQAWEILLVDPSIRVVITDLTMPRLDGYGLLHRIRNSAITRIRELPVVMVSGSDESTERTRAIAAGATDLITKGMDTAPLLSRLGILSGLIATQGALQQGLETLVREAPAGAPPPVLSPDALAKQAGDLLANTVKGNKNFVLLTVRIGLRHMPDSGVISPPPSVVDAIGRLLRNTVRRADHVARTDEAEFTLATGAIGCEAAYCFGQRVCKAITCAKLGTEPSSFVASCGLVSLSVDKDIAGEPDLATMLSVARRRAILGFHTEYANVVGRDEESALQQGRPQGWHGAGISAVAQTDGGDGAPDLLTLVRWIQAGRQADVLPYLDRQSAEVQALVKLALQRAK